MPDSPSPASRPARVSDVRPPVRYGVCGPDGAPIDGRYVVLPLDDPDPTTVKALFAMASAIRDDDPAMAREIVEALIDAAPAAARRDLRRRSA